MTGMTGAMLTRLRSRLRVGRARPETFGLDIGSTAIKVLELHPVPPSYHVVRCAVVPLPPGAVAEGAIHDPGAVVEAIQAARQEAGITRTGAVVGICGREIITKRLQIPDVPARELPDVVRIEAEHEIPFAIDEVALDYDVVGTAPRLLDLTLVAAKGSKIMEYHAVVIGAGLELAVVDIDGFALGNQFQLGARSGLMAVVDIGATMTKVSVVKEGVTQFVRDIPFGGHRCTKAIAARLGTSMEAAEAIKIDAARAPDAVSNACQAMARDLGLEIQRTLDYCAASTAPEAHDMGIVLAGGGARLSGITEGLATTLRLPVEIARPFEGLTIDPACARTVATAGPALALALGLSLRRPHDGSHP